MRSHKVRLVSSLTLFLLSGATTYANPYSALSSNAPTANPVKVVSQNAANLTQAQAIQIATQFCQNAGGFTVVPDVEAHFPSESRTGCWMPCWEVRFKGQAVVEIDDSSGTVTFYGGPEVMQSAPAGPTISKADALAKAASVLQASGITDVDPTPFVSAPQETSFMSPDGGMTVLPSASGHEWIISYNRMFGQIPYLDQTIDISLQAESGILNTFAAHYRSPAPASSAVTLTAEQAADAGWNLVNNGTTIQNAVLESVALCAAQSNHCFVGPDYDEEWLPGPARLAYCCLFVYQPIKASPLPGASDTPMETVSVQTQVAVPLNPGVNSSTVVVSGLDDRYNSLGGETRVLVFVDAQDGSIIAGRMGTMKAIPAFSTLPEWITNTHKVLVYAKDKQGAWVNKPAAVLSENDNRKWFHRIKSLETFTPRVPTKKEKQTASLRLVLVGKTGSHTEEVFYLNTGKLGKPSVQTEVAPELGTWLQDLVKQKAPSH